MTSRRYSSLKDAEAGGDKATSAPLFSLSSLLTKATAATPPVIPWPQGLSPLTVLPLGPTIPFTIIFLTEGNSLSRLTVWPLI